MDKVQCTCKFVASREPMNNVGCRVHTKEKYPCSICEHHICDNYRPRAAPHKRADEKGYVWALCVCGHIAQDHN